MKSEKIVFFHYPNRIVVCESAESAIGHDPETHDLYEYAHIVPKYCQYTDMHGTRIKRAGDIQWTKHAGMLTPEHRQAIVRLAEKLGMGAWNRKPL